jgi:hypothetical protein
MSSSSGSGKASSTGSASSAPPDDSGGIGFRDLKGVGNPIDRIVVQVTQRVDPSNPVIGIIRSYYVEDGTQTQQGQDSTNGQAHVDFTFDPTKQQSAEFLHLGLDGATPTFDISAFGSTSPAKVLDPDNEYKEVTNYQVSGQGYLLEVDF